MPAVQIVAGVLPDLSSMPNCIYTEEYQLIRTSPWSRMERSHWGRSRRCLKASCRKESPKSRRLRGRRPRQHSSLPEFQPVARGGKNKLFTKRFRDKKYLSGVSGVTQPKCFGVIICIHLSFGSLHDVVLLEKA